MKFIIILKIIIEISKLFFFISNNKDKKLQIKYKIKYKMNHQVYGIIIFAGIILLIYLLNYNYIYQNKIEKFITEEDMLVDYIVYDNAFINLDNNNKSMKTTLADVLDECNKNSNYIGFTKENKPIYNYSGKYFQFEIMSGIVKPLSKLPLIFILSIIPTISISYEPR